MSDHIAKLSHEEEATSGTHSHAHPSSWMSHWMKKCPKSQSMVNNSSMTLYNNGNSSSNSCFSEGRLKIEDDFPKSVEGLGKEVKEIATGIIGENVTKKTGNFQNKTSYPPFPALELCQDTETTSAVKPQNDHEFGDKAISLALSLGKDNIVNNFNKLQKSQLRNSEKRVMSHSYPGEKGSTDSRSSAYKEVGSTSHIPPNQSHHKDTSGPVLVFERHFSNDNYTCLAEGHCKYEKISTFLFHEKKMNNELSLELRQSDGAQLHCDPSTEKNFLPFFLKKQSENLHKTHNVETMRICTMVDSMENSPGGPPKISQRAHHLLFTKETCVGMLDSHQEVREPTFPAHHEEKTFGFPRPQGVKIQPLWTSTDSEDKENTFNSSICKVEPRNESSAETEAIQIEVPENQHIMLGTESSSLIKHDAVDANIPQVAFDSRAERTRRKRPIAEIPDINEELPGLQPAVSSTDGTEPSTSRVHSLGAKQLFPFGEQISRSESNAQKDRSFEPDASNRWIKRLKSCPDSFGVGTKSSEQGEASSSEKFNHFFNRTMKCNKTSLENIVSNHPGKEHMKSLENIGSSLSGLKRKNQDMVLGSSWIQRWCRNPSTPTRNPEPLVICEPHSLKLDHDEASKKQLPSIAAMALMGKAMNGLAPCEFRKKGPIVVWKTEY